MTTIQKAKSRQLWSRYLVRLLWRWSIVFLLICCSYFVISLSLLRVDDSFLEEELSEDISRAEQTITSVEHPVASSSRNTLDEHTSSPPLQLEGWRSLCDVLENDLRIVAPSIQFQTSCASSSTGNKLGQFYMTEFLAAIIGVPFLELNCADEDPTQSILGSLPTSRKYAMTTNSTQDSPSKWQEICSECRSNFPHVCVSGLDHMAPTIREDLLGVVQDWERQPEANRTQIDDIAIHIRCGDMLNKVDAKLFKGKYGYSPYVVYDQVLNEHQSIQSIGIITKAFSKDNCSPKECPFVETCNAIVKDAQNYLRSNYPAVTVTVRDDPSESLTTTYARMVLAKAMLCDSSTFCLFPAIASQRGYITQSNELYPWVSQLIKKPTKPLTNVRVVQRPRFLSVKEIAENDMGATEITAWRRGK